MKLFLFILLLTFSYGQKQIRSIDFDEARQIVETQSGIVVDARNPKDYDAGHFPNAINQYARWRELSDIFTDLKKDQFIMVYCSHNRCPYADRVAGMLQASGFTNLA
ncbi:MAG: rhodanese-like domain-containing protein, partial [Calditrichaeota bacterium]|nr:rhodanese-like domain-containing protein [Calditrichota bacterium]